MPRLLWLMFHVPISSPHITRMLGLLASAADNGPPSSSRTAAIDDSMRHLNLFLNIINTNPLVAATERYCRYAPVAAVRDCSKTKPAQQTSVCLSDEYRSGIKQPDR